VSTELFYLEKGQDMNETKYTKFTNKGEKKENDSFWNVRYNLEKENKKKV